MRKLNLIRRAVNTFYAEADPANPTPTPTPTPTLPPDVATNPVTGKPWTKAEHQAEVNRILSEEKKKLTANHQTTIKELEDLRSRSTTSEEDKIQLTQRIETLQNDLQTKEQQQQTAMTKATEKFEAESGKLKSERDSWRSRYEDELFANAVSKATEMHEAFDSEQIDSLLRPKKKIVEELGADGKPTGRFIPKVNFTGEKEGKPVPMEVTVAEAVKMMTEMNKYGNLFKTKAKPGFNQNTNTSGGVKIGDVANMSSDEYEKHRLEIMAAARPQGE